MKALETSLFEIALSPKDQATFEAPYWTLAMTAAWIIWRRPSAVCAYSNECRRRRERTDPELSFQFEVLQKGDVSLWSAINDAQRAVPDGKELPAGAVVSGMNAYSDLWRQLQAGALVATGLEVRHETEDPRAPIAMEHWIDLTFDEVESAGADDVSDGGECVRFAKVMAPSQTVKCLWPGSESRATKSRTLTDNEVDRLLQMKAQELRSRPSARLWKNWPEMQIGNVTKARYESRLQALFPVPKLGRPKIRK